MPCSKFRIFAFIVNVAAILFSTNGTAQPLLPGDLPTELQPWVGWVLDDVPERVCPSIQDEPVCAWVRDLILELDENGGRFVQTVLAEKEIYVRLPGDFKRWPFEVFVNGRVAVVLDQDGGPGVRVGAGLHRITGKLKWPSLPEGIEIPEDTAILSLSVRGEKISFPRRDAKGMLWLTQNAEKSEEDDRLDLTVMRKIRDGVPLSVLTRIVVRASGKSREVQLPNALVANTVPISIKTDIPARVDKEGTLSLQVRAGTHTVTIVARSEGSPKQMRIPRHVEPWPGHEIWVWQADEKLRQAVVSGPSGIDPSRTNLPSEWQDLPAYLMDEKAVLQFVTKRRGEPEPPPDQLHLERELWMDLEGNGFTVQDKITGTLSRTWRMDLAAAGNLGRVAIDGQDQLITTNPETKRPGVELRKSALDMVAEWRVSGKTSALSAVGWSEGVKELAWTLNLPPGWILLTARGVDELPGTWWDGWDLFGFFFVLIISLAIAKLTRLMYGFIGFIGLVLAYQEPEAPFIVWIALLAAVGLLKVLPEGKLKTGGKLLWWVSVIWLIVVLVPFSVMQVRGGLFPQVAGSDSGGMDFTRLSFHEETRESFVEKDDLSAIASNVAQMQQQEMLEPPGSPEEALEGKVRRKRDVRDLEDLKMLPRGSVSMGGGAPGSFEKSGKGTRKYQIAMQQDPKAVVQTGPGVPKWRWNSWQLSWSGPVDKDQKVKLYLVSPLINLIISLLRVVLLVVVAIRLAIEALSAFGITPKWPAGKEGGAKGKGASIARVLLFSIVFTAPCFAAAGEIPSDSILDEMRDRLTRQQPCEPNCVSTSSFDLRAVGTRLTIKAEVHVGATSGWRIPGPAQNWVPTSVTIGGKGATGIALREDGYLHVRVEPGRHTIEVTGPIPKGNTLTLEFGETPRRLTASAPGFTVEGIHEDGRAESTIQITRKSTTAGSEKEGAEFEQGTYPPWLEVTRTLDLGIPWLVHTLVRRVSPTGSPILARVPLLEGESVTESELAVEEGHVALSFGRNDTEIGWSSTLAEVPKITLKAPEEVSWTEVWILRCSPVWQCAFKGLAPIHIEESERFEPTFLPWPGEALQLSMNRPRGNDGQSTTIDSVVADVEPGVRIETVELSLIARSSRGESLNLTLPKGADVQTLTVNDTRQPFRQKEQKIELTLRPGEQKIVITWQQPGGLRSFYRTPRVKVGKNVANATVQLRLPTSRWLLWAGGPSWGPAILFWGYLLTILLAGLILGRLKYSVLKNWQWMLLAFGLTQVPVPVALIIVGWFFGLSWREQHPPTHHVVHNILQIALVVLTVAAAVSLVGAVYDGLAVQPDMQVEGCGSTNDRLVWYVDRTDGTVPEAFVVSVPSLVWKLIMLAWALWLAGSIIKWTPWAWRAFSKENLWRPSPNPKKKRKTKHTEPAGKLKGAVGETPKETETQKNDLDGDGDEPPDKES